MTLIPCVARSCIKTTIQDMQKNAKDVKLQYNPGSNLLLIFLYLLFWFWLMLLGKSTWHHFLASQLKPLLNLTKWHYALYNHHIRPKCNIKTLRESWFCGLLGGFRVSWFCSCSLPRFILDQVFAGTMATNSTIKAFLWFPLRLCLP